MRYVSVYLIVTVKGSFLPASLFMGNSSLKPNSLKGLFEAYFVS